MEHFFPQIQVKTKKRSSTRIEPFFPKFTRSDVHPFKLLGGDADVDHSQTIGGDTAKLLGGYIPPSPLLSAPLIARMSNIFYTDHHLVKS